MYTEEFIKNNWIFNKKYWFNYLAVSEKDININIVTYNIFKFISIYNSESNDNLTAINEDALNKLLSKFKKNEPISAAEYVANKVRYTNKALSDESFYDKSTVINILNEDGTMSKGIIRISNHDTDMQKWAEQNSSYDFGISFVFDDLTNEWNGNDIITISNRTICIYEYDFTVNGTNRQFLDTIISQILGIKRSKIYKFDQNIKGVMPNKRNSRLHEKIMNSIKEALTFLDV